MKKKIQGKFIKGPLKMSVVATLIKEAPPSTLHAYLVVLYVVGLRNSKRIIPNYSHAADMGVNARSFRRGLIDLTNRGIITIVQKPGVKSVVELL
jgi:hypothetical protein